MSHSIAANSAENEEAHLPANTRIRNRRKRYLDLNPEYFSTPNLELADPLLYDRLVRRFQSAAERETEGRRKGYSGVLEADILRSEAKIAALAHPDPNSPLTYSRGPNGEIVPEVGGDTPQTKEEGLEAWNEFMTWRFIRGNDSDFDYALVDENEKYDDLKEERRDQEDKYFAQEEPNWLNEDGSEVESNQLMLKGESGGIGSIYQVVRPDIRKATLLNRTVIEICFYIGGSGSMQKM